MTLYCGVSARPLSFQFIDNYFKIKYLNITNKNNIKRIWNKKFGFFLREKTKSRKFWILDFINAQCVRQNELDVVVFSQSGEFHKFSFNTHSFQRRFFFGTQWLRFTQHEHTKLSSFKIKPLRENCISSQSDSRKGCSAAPSGI